MEIKVKYVEAKDVDELLSMNDLGEMVAKRIVEEIRRNPIEYVNELRNSDVISDKEYKEMVENIRTAELEGDFT